MNKMTTKQKVTSVFIIVLIATFLTLYFILGFIELKGFKEMEGLVKIFIYATPLVTAYYASKYAKYSFNKGENEER